MAQRPVPGWLDYRSDQRSIDSMKFLKCKISNKAMMLDEYKKNFKHFEWPWYMPSIEEYKKLVKPFPFSEIKIWGENADYLFPDSESIVGWINQPSIVPFLKLLPVNQKELFRNFVIEQMLKNTAQENGGYFETFRRINIYAKNANV